MKQARRQASPRRQDDTDVTMDPAPGDDTGDTSSSDSVNYKRRDCKDSKEDRNRKEDDDHGDGKHSGKGRERHTAVRAHKPPKGKEKVKSATKKPQPKSPGTRSRTFGPATVFDSDDESDRRHVYDDTYRGACTTCKKYLKLKLRQVRRTNVPLHTGKAVPVHRQAPETGTLPRRLRTPTGPKVGR
jgi:hypothetical protein